MGWTTSSSSTFFAAKSSTQLSPLLPPQQQKTASPLSLTHPSHPSPPPPPTPTPAVLYARARLHTSHPAILSSSATRHTIASPTAPADKLSKRKHSSEDSSPQKKTMTVSAPFPSLSKCAQVGCAGLCISQPLPARVATHATPSCHGPHSSSTPSTPP